MVRTPLASLLLATSLACAHAPAPAASEDAAIREGDSLAAVRRKLGGHGEIREVSPTERVLSALYVGSCPDGTVVPGDLSRVPCGAARLLTIRLRGDRVVAIEIAEPDAAELEPR